MTKKEYRFDLRLLKDGQNYILNVRAVDGGYPVTGMYLDFPVIEKEGRPGLDFTRVSDGKTSRDYSKELEHRANQMAVLSCLEKEIAGFLASSINSGVDKASERIKVTTDDGTNFNYHSQERHGRLEKSEKSRLRLFKTPRPKKLDWD